MAPVILVPRFTVTTWGSYRTRCDLAIYRAAAPAREALGALLVAVATEEEDNPGPSITNAAEDLWAAVLVVIQRDPVTAPYLFTASDVARVEHYPSGRDSRPDLPESWDLVDHLGPPGTHWTHLGHRSSYRDEHVYGLPVLDTRPGWLRDLLT